MPTATTTVVVTIATVVALAGGAEIAHLGAQFVVERIFEADGLDVPGIAARGCVAIATTITAAATATVAAITAVAAIVA